MRRTRRSKDITCRTAQPENSQLNFAGSTRKSGRRQLADIQLASIRCSAETHRGPQVARELGPDIPPRKRIKQQTQRCGNRY
eukprot:6180645-Alexandrium_andersonii.AAC.1